MTKSTIIEVAGMKYELHSTGNNEITQADIDAATKQLTGCSSCGKGISSLGPDLIDIIVGTSKTLTASASGGTAPFTYTWKITKPDGVIVSLSGASNSYIFALVGVYTIALTITDSCVSGVKTCSDSGSVTTVAACTVPTCSFTIT